MLEDPRLIHYFYKTIKFIIDSDWKKRIECMKKIKVMAKTKNFNSVDTFLNQISKL